MPEMLHSSQSLILQIKRDILRSRSVDMAIGQFFLPGMSPLIEELNGLKSIRLLIGSNAERQDVAEILDRQARLQSAVQAQEAERFAGQSEMRRRVGSVAEAIRRTIGSMTQTDTDAQTISAMLHLLESGVLDMRAYVRERLETNLLLTQFSDGSGTAICGNSNLLLPELHGATTLNLRFGEAEDRSSFTQQYQQWWGEAQPFKDKLTRELRGSWAMQPGTPYLVYLLVLYRLVADRLQVDTPELEAIYLEGFPPLADFQQVAVQQALTILRQHNGVFIADVVGLGKTYIGTALLKRLAQQGQRATIFCPPSLVPMWEDFNEMYGLAAIVVSTGRLLAENGVNLKEPKFQTTDRQIVLIDESHRFRNRDTERYRLLSEYTQGRRCILLTATPYSLRPHDIYAQVRLFADDDIDLSLNPPRLNEFFRRIEEQQASLVDVLRPLLIRRTRKHIQKHYPQAAIGIRQPDGTITSQPLLFPRREKPQVVQYDVEGVYGGGLYDLIISKLGQPAQREGGQYVLPHLQPGEMTYARYGLHQYVRPAYQNKEPYTDLKRAGYAVRGFIRILLFKRLESSVRAFLTTVRAILGVHERFLTALANGYVPAGDQGQSLLYEQNWTDEDELLSALAQMDRRYAPEAFNMPRLQRDLENDRDVLRELESLLSPLTPAQDSKLQTLRELLTKELKGRKVLLFTQFETTAEYLSENLSDLPQTAWLSGRHRSAGRSFMETLARFAPKANPLFVRSGAEPIQTLVATDVLSEGLNLQDCSLVINYDLHWNPVRLIQRVGRVDRIGSEADSIRLINFLPERNVEKVLNLEKTLRERIAEIHSFIGEDNAILHPDEKLNEADFYAAYTQAPEAEENDATALAVDFTEIEERVRQLQKDQPGTMQAVLDLPAGVRAARKSVDGKTGAFLYFAADDYEQIVMTDKHGEICPVSLEQMLAAIECDVNEASLALPKNHNVLVSRALQRFEEEAMRRHTDQRTGPRLTPGQKYALKHLHAFLKSEENEERRHTLVNIERVLRSRLPEAALKELNAIRRLGLTNDPLLQRLLQAYRDLDLGRYLDRPGASTQEPSARIICSEALVGEDSGRV